MHVIILVAKELFGRASLCKSVHREEVGNVFLAVNINIFNDVSPNDILLRHQVMDDIILRHFVVDFVLRLLHVKKLQNCGSISFRHLTNFTINLDGVFGRKFVMSDEITHLGDVSRLRGVFDLAQFLYVNEPVHECGCAEWGWHRVARGVVGLGESVLSLSPHHFLDHYLSQSLFSQLPVNCQEVHLGHLHGLPINHNLLGASYERCHNLFVLGVNNQEIQILDPSRVADTPSELFLGVVQPEIALCVLDVVVHQELTNSINLCVVISIKSVPLESRR